MMRPALSSKDLSTMLSLFFLLLLATWTERVACCTDFDPKCALVEEIRNSNQVIILRHVRYHGKLTIVPTFFQSSLADVVCNYGLKDYCPVACNNCNVNGMKGYRAI